MLIAIPIVLVMYFALLHARFEGERYAPGKIEKWIVLAGIGLGILGNAFYIASVNNNPRFWIDFSPALFVAYLVLIPVRMMFRTKILPIETAIVVAAILATILIWVILPALAG